MGLENAHEGADQARYRHPGESCFASSLFLTAFDDSTDAHLTIAMDAHSGEEYWSRTIETDRVEQQHTIGSPASATIASDGERVFVFFGSYGLVCYSLDGNQLWSKPMGPFQDEFGSSSSPILVGDKLILNLPTSS